MASRDPGTTLTFPAARSTPAQRFGGVALCLIMIVAAVLSLQHVREPVGFPMWFVPTYGAVMSILQLLTAYLLLRQAQSGSSAATALVAAAYIITGFGVLAQTLTFGGVFTPGELLGATPDTASWLYFFFHAGFGAAIALYVVQVAFERPGPGGFWRKAAVRAIPIVALLATAAMIAAAIRSDVFLPPLQTVVDYFNPTRMMWLRTSAIVLAIALAGTLVRAALRSALDLWLSVAVLGWLLDVSLSLAGAPRYALGWYEGRFDAIISGSVILILLSYDYGRSLLAMKDLSERLSAAAEFRTMAEAIPQVIFTLDAKGDLEFITNRWFELTGLTPQQGYAFRAWTSVVHPDDIQPIFERMQRSLAMGEAFDLDLRMRLADGAYRWFRTQALPYRDAGGTIAKWYGTLADVHRQKQAEQSLRTLAESIPQIVWTANPDGWSDWFNERWFRYTGQSFEQAKGWGWQSMIAEEDLPRVMHRWPESLRSGRPFDMEFRIRGSDGVPRWFLCRIVPLRDEFGNIVKWYGSNTLIEDQKQQEEVLKELYGREHRVAETLQLALLPRFLPKVSGLRFDSVYRPNTTEANVGGDWYDAFELPDGSIAISLGDVAGHGLDAAVTMGRVRETFRAAASIEFERPDLVLQRANRALMLADPDVLVTALFGAIDPHTLRFTYATAGHPAPMLARKGQPVHALPGGGIPLGYDADSLSPVHDIQLEPGDFLAVYTDGLVESTRDLMAGEARLIEALALEVLTLSEKPAEAIVNAVLGGEPRDDVALLTIAVQVRPLDALDLKVPAQPESAPLLRSRLNEFIGRSSLDEDASFNLTLAVGEAVNNAIEHAYAGRAGADVELHGRRFEGRLIVEVKDRGDWHENGRLAGVAPPDTSERGRGLFLMQHLCPDYAIERTPEGTTVRFSVPLV